MPTLQEVIVITSYSIHYTKLYEFDPTDDIADISDTVAISAHFIEQCTEVAISSPADQWTVNSKNTNALTGKPEMHVKFSNYDLNHDKFEDFMFQYKPSEQSTVITSYSIHYTKLYE